MQFTTLFALSALSAFSIAAPLEARNGGGSTVCCPKGKTSGCSPCGSSGKCPSGDDTYGECSQDLQVGLVNVFICDVLNDLTLSVPITVDLL